MASKCVSRPLTISSRHETAVRLAIAAVLALVMALSALCDRVFPDPQAYWARRWARRPRIRATGDVGHLVNPRRLVDPGVQRPTAPAGAVDAEDLSGEAFHQGGTDGASVSSSATVLTEATIDNAAGDRLDRVRPGRVTSDLGPRPARARPPGRATRPRPTRRRVARRR